MSPKIPAPCTSEHDLTWSKGLDSSERSAGGNRSNVTYVRIKSGHVETHMPTGRTPVKMKAENHPGRTLTLASWHPGLLACETTSVAAVRGWRKAVSETQANQRPTASSGEHTKHPPGATDVAESQGCLRRNETLRTRRTTCGQESRASSPALCG